MAVLGCAQEYRAVIHWRGGSLPFTSPAVSSLTSVKWNRTVNDTSEATITIAKAMAGDCCGLLGQIEPYVHELSIYRDSELVWQGPVIRSTENRTKFTIEARDVTESIIKLNLNGGLFASEPDWPHIVPYVVRDDDSVDARFEKDGTANTEVWLVPILQILDEELVPRGLEYTTVGRALVLGRPQTTSDPAQARLTLDAFAGDIEIVRDGTNAATLIWVTNQHDDDISGSQFGVSGVVSAYYGRLDTLVRTSAEGLSAYDLWQIARSTYNGRNPVPTSLRIPTGAGLAPSAPVSMRQLVPGVRIDVAATGMCMGLTQPYRLSDVDVEWGDSGENVGISLIPLGDPFTGDPPPP